MLRQNRLIQSRHHELGADSTLQAQRPRLVTVRAITGHDRLVCSLTSNANGAHGREIECAPGCGILSCKRAKTHAKTHECEKKLQRATSSRTRAFSRASGTWKNFKFLSRSCLFTEREPVTKLICSTFQPWRYITSLTALRREAYWFPAVNLALIRYLSQTSDTRLYSRIQKTPALFPAGGRTAMPSGRIRQNLSFAIASFDWPSWTLLASPSVRGRSISRVLVACHIAACPLT